MCYGQQKTTQAVRTLAPPKIDGSLEDTVWGKAPALTDFSQNSPEYQKPVAQKTIVKVLYDNAAIYIGAYLYDDPSQVRKQMTGRDGESRQNVDFFSFFLDTYNDHQNGFQFLVTPNNVQTDARLSPAFPANYGTFGDLTWDAVWESKVKMQPDGWSLEMRIPYFSIRFSKAMSQDWGIQFLRYFRRNNEFDYWNNVNPNLNGFVNQFGILKNLDNITPPLRLSFFPYITTGYRKTPETGGYLKEGLVNGGMDVKWGVNESFTLDATLIPDFGQVLSDDVVNNLTPYETKFVENRPFFTEGTELFNKADLFYSRRVGSTPSLHNEVQDFTAGNPGWKITKNPALTQLYNAIKFSGRTKNKLGIGIFNAVTAPVYAKLKNISTGKDSTIQTEPLANYNVIVLDQSFKGQSYITFTNTNVRRHGSGRNANVAGLDLALYDRQNQHKLFVQERFSSITKVKPNDGFRSTVSYGKVSGKWQYLLYNDVISDKYNPNDLGYLDVPNKITYSASLSYHQLTATDKLNLLTYTLQPQWIYSYYPYGLSRFDITGSAFWVFKNFWDVTLTAKISPGHEHNYFELRTPGKFIDYPSDYFFNVTGSTDSRKKLFWSYNVTYAVSPGNDNKLSQWDMSLRYRFSNQFSMEAEGQSSYEKNQLGFAFIREANGDPVAAFRNNTAFATIVNINYNFTSQLYLSLRTRHYWNKVNNLSFHDVNANGKLTDRPFIAGNDQNVNFFNVDGFLTWDFRLGSKVIVGYKNWLGNEEPITITGQNNYWKNLDATLKARHGNEVTVRFIYYLNYSQFKKKKQM